MGRIADIEKAVLELQRKVEAYKPVSGNGVQVTDVTGGSGRAIAVPLIAPQNNAAALAQLQIFVKDQSTSTIGITAGQVAGLVEDGTDTWSVSGNGTIWAQVDVSTSMAFSNLSIFDNGSSGPPAIDTTHAFQLIGNYVTTAGVLSAQPMVAGSQGLSVCFSDPTTANVIPTWALV